MKRDLCWTEVFWESPECQNCSKGGKNLGKKGTNGDLYRYGGKCIQTWQPDQFVIEQTDNILAARHAKALAGMKRQIVKLEIYDLWDGILDCMDYGIPQGRKRYFLIDRKSSLKKRKLTNVLPPPTVPCVPLILLLDDEGEPEFPEDSDGLPNLIHCFKTIIKKKKKNPLFNLFVCDVYGSNPVIKFERFNTITATRAQQRAYFITSKLRFVKTKELFRLMGMIPNRLKTQGVKERAVGHCIGNAVPVNVIRAIFRALQLNHGG